MVKDFFIVLNVKRKRINNVPNVKFINIKNV